MPHSSKHVGDCRLKNMISTEHVMKWSRQITSKTDISSSESWEDIPLEHHQARFERDAFPHGPLHVKKLPESWESFLDREKWTISLKNEKVSLIVKRFSLLVKMIFSEKSSWLRVEENDIERKIDAPKRTSYYLLDRFEGITTHIFHFGEEPRFRQTSLHFWRQHKNSKGHILQTVFMRFNGRSFGWRSKGLGVSLPSKEKNGANTTRKRPRM